MSCVIKVSGETVPETGLVSSIVPVQEYQGMMFVGFHGGGGQEGHWGEGKKGGQK
jgi:hypothetical protein